MHLTLWESLNLHGALGGRAHFYEFVTCMVDILIPLNACSLGWKWMLSAGCILDIETQGNADAGTLSKTQARPSSIWSFHSGKKIYPIYIPLIILYTFIRSPHNLRHSRENPSPSNISLLVTLSAPFPMPTHPPCNGGDQNCMQYSKCGQSKVL